jgi:ectoine hydroxylase-related dioxygenase (phytanoyl-CoA dioxygenase family)
VIEDVLAVQVVHVIEANIAAVATESGRAETIEDLKTSLDRDGYVIFDPELPPGVVDGAVSEIESDFRPESSLERTIRRGRRALPGGRARTLSKRDEVRVQDAWVKSDSVKAIALAPRILELLRSAYGREPRAFQTINFRVGSQQRPHSDAMHFNSEPPGMMCGVWVALEDIDLQRGPLVYYPGSHRLAEVTMGEVFEAGLPDGANYEDFVADLIDREGLEAEYATIRKGEALLWASNLIHGGAPQTDPALTRWSQVTHYFFEDCRYWKPLASDREHREYWQPTWVR